MSAVAGLLILIGCVVFSLFFLFGAAPFHLQKPEIPRQMAEQEGFPAPWLAGRIPGVWLAIAALSISFGIWPDIGSLMIAAFVIPAMYFHRFWKIEDQQMQAIQSQLFFRNVTFLGAALIMFTAFALFGDALRFSITAPAVELR